jgi:hypothetical protein
VVCGGSSVEDAGEAEAAGSEAPSTVVAGAVEVDGGGDGTELLAAPVAGWEGAAAVAGSVVVAAAGALAGWSKAVEATGVAAEPVVLAASISGPG